MGLVRVVSLRNGDMLLSGHRNEMLRVDTKLVIAGVMNLEFTRGATMGHLEANTMGGLRRARAHSYLAVSVTTNRTRPFPALTIFGPEKADLLPEPFSEGGINCLAHYVNGYVASS